MPAQVSRRLEDRKDRQLQLTVGGITRLFIFAKQSHTGSRLGLHHCQREGLSIRAQGMLFSSTEIMHWCACQRMALRLELAQPVLHLGGWRRSSVWSSMARAPRSLMPHGPRHMAQPLSLKSMSALMLICYIYKLFPLLTLARMRPRLELEQPILRSAELDALKRLDFRGWRTAVIDATWPAADGAAGLEAALQRICDQATAAIAAGHSFLVLSDRAAGADVTSCILSHDFLKLPGEHAAAHFQSGHCCRRGRSLPACALPTRCLLL